MDVVGATPPRRRSSARAAVRLASAAHTAAPPAPKSSAVTAEARSAADMADQRSDEPSDGPIAMLSGANCYGSVERRGGRVGGAPPSGICALGGGGGRVGGTAASGIRALEAGEPSGVREHSTNREKEARHGGPCEGGAQRGWRRDASGTRRSAPQRIRSSARTLRTPVAGRGER